MNYFITGTDTGVGKTFFTTLLARAALAAGHNLIALKPICCGPRDDVESFYAAMRGRLSLDEINPLWFTEPAAPLVAARAEGRAVDLTALAAWFHRLRSTAASVLVEGAGGWLVPLTPKKTVADLAIVLQLPVLVVVANKLGCLNHTLLTVQGIRTAGLTCAGLVLNNLSGDSSFAARTNRALLAEICDVPVLYELQPGQTELTLA